MNIRPTLAPPGERLFLVVLCLLSCSAGLFAQACDCREKIYLNDEVLDLVHKFDVDPATGMVAEIGSPWFGPISGLNPHGIAADLNGDVFFGRADGFGGTGVQGPMFETRCDGELITDDFLGDENGIHFNIAARDGALYIPDNASGTIRAYRICDGELIGTMNLAPGAGGQGLSWGFSIDETSWYFASRSGNGEVYSGSLDTTLFASPATNSGAVLFSTGASGNFAAIAPMGITHDADRNFYVVFNRLDGTGTAAEIRKYDPDGNLVATISDNVTTVNTGNGSPGFWGARGIVYSALTDQLYVSAQANCLAVFDTDLVEQPAINYGNPTAGRAKGIGIVRECCPVPANTVIDTTICLTRFGQGILLRELLNCDGAICEGEFTQSLTDADIEFDPCNNLVVPNGEGRVTFEQVSDGTAAGAFCGPYTIELNINFVAPPTIDVNVNCTPAVNGPPTFTLTVPVTASPLQAGDDVFLDLNGTEIAAGTIGPAGNFTFTDVPTNTGPSETNIVAIRLGDDLTCATSRPVDFNSCNPGCIEGPGSIGGNAFNDLGNEGADAGERDEGLSNVRVRVFDCNDMLVCETFTNADGDWGCTGLNDGDRYRVEFSTPLNPEYEPSRFGPDNGTDNQLVTSPGCDVNVGYITDMVCPPAIIESHALGDLSSEGRLLSSGVGMITCGSIVDPDFPPDMQWSFGLLDIRDATFAPNRPTIDLVDFHHPDWTVTQIGNVFGITVDTAGAIYTTASSHYGAAFGYGSRANFREAILRYGEIGGGEDDLGAAGTIYKLDPITGQPTVWAQLPQQLDRFRVIGCESSASDFNRSTGVGLGNIDYDEANNQFFVSNFEDGAIYRLDPDGNILQVFDPQTAPGFLPDDGTPGLANDFKPYGLAATADGRRLYFGSHIVDADPNTSLEVAGVYFVELADDGSITGTESLLTIIEPEPPTDPRSGFNAFGRDPGWLSISDLDFNADGDLLIAIRTGCGTRGQPLFASTHNHGATYLIYQFDDGSIFNIETRYRGDVPPVGTGNDDGYGGIGIWDKHDGTSVYAVSSSDISSELGPHGIMVFPGDFTQSGTSATDFILKPSAAIPYFRNLTSNDFKGVGGDVKVFSPCGPVIPEIGNYAWIDEDADGIQDPCEPPLVGLTVNLYSMPDDGSPPVLLATTVTDASGQYYFAGAAVDGDRVEWLTDEDRLITGQNYSIAYPGDGNLNTNVNELTIDGVAYELTSPNVTTNNGNDQNDSDAEVTTIAGVDVIATTTVMGQFDRTNQMLDVGFVPVVYDLALRKTLADNAGAAFFNPGDQVIFNLEIINQGTETVFDVLVGDQVPAGLTTLSLDVPAVTTASGAAINFTDSSSEPGLATFTLDSLGAQDSVLVTLTFRINDPFDGTFPLINVAEIQSFDNDADPATPPPADIDSTPDDDFSNDAGGLLDSPADNFILGDGTGFPDQPDPLTDEDDADPASIPYHDVALTKAVDQASLGPDGFATENELIDFVITVLNQGNLPVRDVVIADKIPCGFDFVGAGAGTAPVNAEFTGDNTGATATIPGPIEPGDLATVTIQLRLRATGELGAACAADDERFVNRAEIASIDPDGPGGDPPLERDVDSNFDENDDAEDGGGMPISNTDNAVNGDGTGVAGSNDPATDDDDEDAAVTAVVDIALAKTIDEAATGSGAGPPYRIGDLVKFDLLLVNQGSTPLTGIDVVDVLPAGLEYEATAGDAGWTYDAATRTASTTLAGVLTPADPTATISLYARIVAPTGDPMVDYLNEAEVSEIDAEIQDGNGILQTVTLNQDSDSPLNTDISDNSGGLVNTDDDNNLDGGGPARNEDQDNADPAFVEVALLALGSTVYTDGNNNGLQDAGEAGIPDVEVQIFNATTGMQVTTTSDGVVTTNPMDVGPVLTDADGNYLFSNLEPGDYFVVLPSPPADNAISSNNLTSGFTETDPDDDLDGDDEGTQTGGPGTPVTSGTITLEPLAEPEMESGQGGELDNDPTNGLLDENGNMTVDFGFFAPVSLGDQAFIDLSGDGVRDPDEPGLQGVTITLFDATTGQPVTFGADGNPYAATVMTDENGLYSFTNLPPGDYFVQFDLSTAVNADFYDFTVGDSGDDDANDSDAFPTGGPRSDLAVSQPVGFLSSGESAAALTAGVICAVEVVEGGPIPPVCRTQPIVLDSVATILQEGLAGEWTTSGDGTFLTLDGSPNPGFALTSSVVAYLPGPLDGRRGEVTLTLTTDDPMDQFPPSPCGPDSGSVVVPVLNVECGNLLWDGEN